MNRWRRLGLAALLLAATVGLGVYADATEDERWPYPTADEIASEYDAHVGQRALLFGTVETIDGSTARIRVESDAGQFQVRVDDFDAAVESGGVVQVYGTLEPGGTVAAERVVVVNPTADSTTFKYLVSAVAVALFLVAFFRYWRIDVERLRLEDRDG